MKSELDKLKDKTKKKESINNFIKDIKKQAAESQKYNNQDVRKKLDQLFK